MHKKLILTPMILDLFEGGAAGAAGGSAGATGGTAPAAGEQGTGDLSKVIYGKQESAPAPESTGQTTQQSDADSATPTTEERTKAYRDLIQGEYKDLYNEDVQRIVKGRLKGYDDLKKTSASQQEIIDRLAAKYGVTDLGEIAAAIDNDSGMWEQEADKAGMTTEQYMQFQQLQRQNASLIREEQARAEQEQRNRKLNEWMQEAEGVRQMYPSFDLEREVSNDRFRSMLLSGVPMADAYRAMHFEEIQNQTAVNAARQAETAVAANVRANGSRPVENGTRTQSAFTVKSDVSKLNKKDRAEIARRVARGERISF